jgi:cytosine/adenosine deaminase-related metal-dependent hydrolase
MRIVSFIPAVLALFVSGAACAQTWGEFVDRADHFTVNFPGDPAKADLTYKTAKGTSLPAHVYTAQDARGRYVMTVVNYAYASPDELATAIEEAAVAVRAKGTVKYDGTGMMDNHKSQRITVEIPGARRLLAEILVSADKRLYISEADTALNAAPPAQYQASLQILDDDGVRIRYRAVGNPERVR